MRLASTGLSELVPNVLWLIEKRLQVLEEIVLGGLGISMQKDLFRAMYHI